MTILLVIAIILFILWAVGLGTRRTLGGLVHIALAIALVLLIIWLLRAVLHVI